MFKTNLVLFCATCLKLLKEAYRSVLKHLAARAAIIILTCKMKVRIWHDLPLLKLYDTCAILSFHYDHHIEDSLFHCHCTGLESGTLIWKYMLFTEMLAAAVSCSWYYLCPELALHQTVWRPWFTPALKRIKGCVNAAHKQFFFSWSDIYTWESFTHRSHDEIWLIR